MLLNLCGRHWPTTNAAVTILRLNGLVYDTSSLCRRYDINMVNLLTTRHTSVRPTKPSQVRLSSRFVMECNNYVNTQYWKHTCHGNAYVLWTKDSDSA